MAVASYEPCVVCGRGDTTTGFAVQREAEFPFTNPAPSCRANTAERSDYSDTEPGPLRHGSHGKRSSRPYKQEVASSSLAPAIASVVDDTAVEAAGF